MRAQFLAVLAALGALWAAGPVSPAWAADHAGLKSAVTDISAQSRPRRAPRIRVTRQARVLPPDAVRECQAWYVQEHRPSGTVITPRMQCWWTR